MTRHHLFAIRFSPFRRCAARLLVLSLLVTAGCGLGDYEQLMDRERARVKVFDEENRLLDRPLKMPTVNPTKGDSKEQPALLQMTVFLRPPKGVGSECADRDNSRADKDKPGADKKDSGFARAYNATGIPLFRYEGAQGADLRNVFLAGDMGTLEMAQFEQEVLKVLPNSLSLIKKEDVPKVVKTPLQSPSAKPRPIEFHALVLDEPPGSANPSRYLVYFHRSDKYRVAVVYQVKPDMTSEVSKAIDFSVKTLGIGPKDAAEQQKAYVERLAYFPSKKS